VNLPAGVKASDVEFDALLFEARRRHLELSSDLYQAIYMLTWLETEQGPLSSEAAQFLRAARQRIGAALGLVPTRGEA
jgi:hypothetical protein